MSQLQNTVEMVCKTNFEISFYRIKRFFQIDYGRKDMGFVMHCKKFETAVENRRIRDIFAENNRLMALAISSVPVLTGKVAERFVDICEYNSEHLACSQYSEEREKWVKKILKKSKEFKSEASGK